MKQQRKSQSKAQELSARDKLSKAVDEDFAADWAINGRKAVEEMRAKDPSKYVEAAVRRIATVESKPGGMANAHTLEEIAIQLLKNIGLSEDLITPVEIKECVEANNIMVAKLEAIRDRAQGLLQ
jgi:hypothetical protein